VSNYGKVGENATAAEVAGLVGVRMVQEVLASMQAKNRTDVLWL
jgi:hypothetical protein